MSTKADSSGEDEPAPVVLRWLDDSGLNSREEAVQIIDSKSFEATVSSSVQLDSDTQVDLVGLHYTERGVVSACQADGAKFIVIIRLHPEHRNPPLGTDRDPGVFAIDNFLTEEDELRILAELDEEIRSRQTSSLSAVSAFPLVRSSNA